MSAPEARIRMELSTDRGDGVWHTTTVEVALPSQQLAEIQDAHESLWTGLLIAHGFSVERVTGEEA